MGSMLIGGKEKQRSTCRRSGALSELLQIFHESEHDMNVTRRFNEKTVTAITVHGTIRRKRSDVFFGARFCRPAFVTLQSRIDSLNNILV